jgi:hypothetical protein
MPETIHAIYERTTQGDVYIGFASAKNPDEALADFTRAFGPVPGGGVAIPVHDDRTEVEP